MNVLFSVDTFFDRKMSNFFEQNVCTILYLKRESKYIITCLKISPYRRYVDIYVRPEYFRRIVTKLCMADYKFFEHNIYIYISVVVCV